jgi:hypothetical protein
MFFASLFDVILSYEEIDLFVTRVAHYRQSKPIKIKIKEKCFLPIWTLLHKATANVQCRALSSGFWPLAGFGQL